MNHLHQSLFVGILSMTLLSFNAPLLAQTPNAPDELEQARQSIRAETIRAHLRYLADDLLEGRGPGTRGAELAAKYIAAQFEASGLEPVGGSYFQNVPIINIKADNSTVMTAEANGKKEVLKLGEEFTAQNGLGQPYAKFDGVDIVFVGYGITAPEYQWDDYKGTDVKGKILMMMVNDPPSEDPKFFGGKTLTYYGRWTYKYEEAARHGARGVLLIHTTETATYPWQVVQSSNTGFRSDLVRDTNSPPVVELKSWIQHDAGVRFAKLGGKDLVELEKQAQTRTFKPVPLGVKLNLELKSEVKKLNSPNVVGLLRGSDPKLKEEYIVFTAHYDHLGVREDNPGDKIYNGAIDNASGVAALLTIAEAMARLKTPPKRSILFMSVTAEEQGLLGSQYYAEHPLLPLLATAANVNLDEINVHGRTRDFTPMGAERSSLGPILDKIAKEQNLVMKPDPFPEKGSFFRSDHFCFAKVGVPCVTLQGGVEVIGKPEGWGKQKWEEYNSKDYHQPSDELKPDFDFRGSQQHARLTFQVITAIANQPAMPEWNEGEAFKNARDAMKKK